MPDNPRALAISLLLLRVGVAIVMIFWTADKFVNPQHAAGVFENFYGLGGLGHSALLVIGIVEALFVLAFVAGAFKTISYAAILLMHSVSTLSSAAKYMEPFNNLMFLAAWPMLAACVSLFLLRSHDRLLSIDALRSRLS